MIRLTKLLLGLGLLTFECWAQTPINYVATTGNVSLSSAATAATIQAPASGGLSTLFPPTPAIGASVYCSVTCTATVIVNATAPTTTLGTANPVNVGDSASFLRFYTASNYSGGTTLVVYNIAAGGLLTLDMSPFHLSSTNTNVTIAINAITGTANITFFPQEIH